MRSAEQMIGAAALEHSCRRVYDHAVLTLRIDRRATDICAKRLNRAKLRMLKTRSAIYLQFVAVVSTLVLLSVLARFFPIVDLIAAAQQRMMQWGAAGAICYPLLFAVCNVLLLPGGILCVGAGFFFGLWWGFVIVFTGNAVGAAGAFAFSRWLAGGWLRQRFALSPRLQVLEPAVEREGWKIIFLSQLHPLFPASLLNYFYGLTRIPFRTYMLWVSIGRAPGLFLYVYLGTLGQFGINLARGKSHPRMVEYWVWGGAFVVSALLIIVASRIAMRAIQKAQETVRAAESRQAREMPSARLRVS
jgi:uncharacterized membrane protein YdjX (TVP38/TMEM64 family)